MIAIVAKGLKDLAEEVVFVGGATTALYIDDPGYPEVRPTDDVDCIVKIASRLDYARLEKKLRVLGFQHEQAPGSPLCRWKFCGVTVDVMPTSEGLLGFSNRWYESGIAQSKKVNLPDGVSIRILSVAHFLATKLEAFRNRGSGDYRFSSDFEDIVTILDGCSYAEAEIASAHLDLKEYFAEQFSKFLRDPTFEEGIYSHLVPGYSGSRRVDGILAILRRLQA